VAGKQQPDNLPSRDALLDFIRLSASPVGKREIAREFRLSATGRGEIAHMLDTLEDEGAIRRARGRRYIAGNRLPSVTVLDVVGLDSDGEPVVALSDDRITDKPPAIRLTSDRKRGRAPGLGDRVLARLTEQRGGHYTAQVMRVLERRPTRVFGVFRVSRSGGRLDPADRRFKSQFLIADGNTGNASDGEFVACETLPGRAFGLPLAKVVTRIGTEKDATSVSPLVIAKNEIPVEFTPEALALAEKADAAPMDKRDDLRSLKLVTIDDESARDYDDAVWAEPDPSGDNPGGWHLIVAIADVAWYVRPDDALDQAAHERGNSVYLPDRVIPMLPEALSNGWCSLNPDEDRPCMTVDMWIDARGHKIRHKFRRSMMRSAARLTYTQLQRSRDGEPSGDTRHNIPEGIIEPLYGAFQALQDARKERGAIDLDMPERRAVLAGDGSIDRIESRVRLDSHRLIEEFMILANVCAAETLEKVGQPCMYRLHDDPAPDRIAVLRGYLQTLGLKLAGGQAVRPKHFAQLVSRLDGRPEVAAVQDAILRSQAKAEYGPENVGHFGLALRNYAHFTSPIRRYSDLLVHRALIAGLRLGDGALDTRAGLEFAEIGSHISMTERRATAAEREAFDRLCTLYLVDRVGAEFSARVSGVERFGLFVELEETGADGLVPISALGDEYFEYDERRLALCGRGSGEEFRLGDRIRVRLAEANPATGSLRMELADRAPREDSPKRHRGRGKGAARGPGNGPGQRTGRGRPGANRGRHRPKPRK
jgi:ribonuclease R